MRLASPVVLVAALLAGCAAAPPAAPPDSLLADRLFAPPREAVRTDDLFALSDAMRRYLAVDIADQIRLEGPQVGLVEALQKHAQLRLEYDAARTKNAAATFASRTGNCLSLVIMTAAFAKELGVPVAYQAAYLEETWSRTGNLLIASGHVNITLGAAPARRQDDARPQPDDDRLPAARETCAACARASIGEDDDRRDVRQQPRRRGARRWPPRRRLCLGRRERAPRSGVRRRLQHARRRSTFATATSPSRARRSSASSPATPRTRARSPTSPRRTLGRGAPATRRLTRTRLAALEPYPPFHFFELGMAAVRRDDWRAARELFAREVARADANHEFHFWLGVADWRLGEESAALRHLTLAMDNSLTRDQHDLYAAKLAWLQGAPPARSARDARAEAAPWTTTTTTAPQRDGRWSTTQIPRAASATGACSRRCARCRATRSSPRGCSRDAYEDTPLPIEEGQTISQPYIVALMLEAARLGAATTGCSRSAPARATRARSRAASPPTSTRSSAIRAWSSSRASGSRGSAAPTSTCTCGDGSVGWPAGRAVRRDRRRRGRPARARRAARAARHRRQAGDAGRRRLRCAAPVRLVSASADGASARPTWAA